MTREFDTADMFAPRERARFGENEELRSAEAANGKSSKKYEIVVVLKNEKPASLAVIDPAKPHLNDGRWIWLPKSQIEWSYHRSFGKDQSIVICIPEWLAKDKGLI